MNTTPEKRRRVLTLLKLAVLVTAFLAISCVVWHHYQKSAELWNVCIGLDVLSLILAAMAISFSKKQRKVLR
ncbi:MAG: hypothetical protein ACRD23_15650 [Terriglobales bacterium]